MDGPWTLAELTAKAAAELAADHTEQTSGRVRDLPNERLIRWYVTIGLVDPPLGRRGRVALYGPRHLLQLVAVKRRQAAGRSLAEIQEELTGATDEMLQSAAENGPPKSPRTRFWSHDADAGSLGGNPNHGGLRGVAPRASTDISAASRVLGVRLRPGVTLLLDGAELGEADVAAITAAAGPLVDVLESRGLIRPEGSAP